MRDSFLVADANNEWNGLIAFFLMTLQIEIKLLTDGQETTLAHESAHVTGLTHTQTVFSKKIAQNALNILTGNDALHHPVEVHLCDHLRD